MFILEVFFKLRVFFLQRSLCDPGTKFCMHLKHSIVFEDKKFKYLSAPKFPSHTAACTVRENHSSMNSTRLSGYFCHDSCKGSIIALLLRRWSVLHPYTDSTVHQSSFELGLRNSTSNSIKHLQGSGAGKKDSGTELE